MPPRVFIGFHEIAGFYAGLRAGLEALGCQVSFVEAEVNPFGYDTKGNSSDLEKSTWEAFFSENPHGQFKQRLALWRVIRAHDVFIFTYGRSFPGVTRHWALPWLKRFGKKVIFILTGSEGRPTYIDRMGYSRRDGRPILAPELVHLTRDVAENVSQMEAHADLLITHSLTAQFHSRPFVSFLRLGNPASYRILARGCEPEPRDPNERTIRILHAPSWPELKGTEFIRAAVAAMRDEGFDLTYTELSGVTNVQVIEQLRRTDLLIDELYSDIPMASLAAESAALGVPALVGGYGWEALRSSPDKDVIPPAFFCQAETVPERLREILQGGIEKIAKKGQEAHVFLRDNWQPKVVAGRLLRCISDRPPNDWFIDPAELEYAWGCGVPKVAIAEMVSSILSQEGEDGLFIKSKPSLMRQYRQLLESMNENNTEASDGHSADPGMCELLRRNQALQLRLTALVKKIDTQKAMIKRRDEKIVKLEKKG